jgi:hypothetical protein
VVVYASGRFKDGKYSKNNSHFCDVALPLKGTKECKIST